MEAVYGLETTGVLLNARFSEMMVRREVNEEQQITENDRKELAEAQEWYAQEQFLATLVSTLQETTARIISQIPTTQQHHVNILQRIEKRSTQKRESRTRWMASGNFQNFRVGGSMSAKRAARAARPRERSQARATAVPSVEQLDRELADYRSRDPRVLDRQLEEYARQRDHHAGREVQVHDMQMYKLWASRQGAN
ncbi:uncharacterized protein LOC126380381 isoform X2 [Pectinophora gossypiella]|uniref:uncharacterized protein LOC126380381 isoform X2 n=1 Tax=Pectinophora gossypiella TaxID=13191 RepID=UPI00214F07F3|nr:uncharacterized protein LOC126380381 isoform X2 [Pectinophora gossypiella]